MPLVSSGGGAFTGGVLTSDVEIRGPATLYVEEADTDTIMRVSEATGFRVASAALGNVVEVDTSGRLTLTPQTGGVLFTLPHAAPADAELAAGYWTFWLDQTPAATKLMVKAKDSGGTVRTASIALA